MLRALRHCFLELTSIPCAGRGAHVAPLTHGGWRGQRGPQPRSPAGAGAPWGADGRRRRQPVPGGAVQGARVSAGCGPAGGAAHPSGRGRPAAGGCTGVGGHRRSPGPPAGQPGAVVGACGRLCPCLPFGGGGGLCVAQRRPLAAPCVRLPVTECHFKAF